MARKTGRVATADSYDNFIARVGMQQPNQHAASTYRANYTSRNRLLIEWAYRSSWIIGAAVDSKADDMTKKGVRITSEIDPKRRGILESRFDELLASYIEKPQGKPTLVPDSDTRPAMNNAKTDFMEENDYE